MIAGPIRNLIREFRKLPGIGEKTAMRLALHVLGTPADRAEALAMALVEVKKRIRPCSECYQMTEEALCEVCTSHRRDRSIICVVEDQAALMAIENTRSYFGLYHVLCGRLSPVDAMGPDDLTVPKLVERAKCDEVKEVVLATNPDVEGEATALYVKRELEPLDVQVTRIARGVPIGGELEYADALTLGRAFEGRGEF
jgi:recombination protein RecR